MKIIAANKKANFDYFIISKFEAGLVLTGSEVKSLRINTGSIKESFIIEKEGELWLTNCYIKKYSSLASIFSLITIPLCAFVFSYDKNTIYILIYVSFLIIIKHTSNIRRLLNGSENKIKF